MSFYNYHDFEQRAKALDISDSITEPPCTKCKFWRPKIKTNDRGEFDGIRLCSAKDMYFDFSCFENKE